jgi:hypothetical protein
VLQVLRTGQRRRDRKDFFAALVFGTGASSPAGFWEKMAKFTLNNEGISKFT